MRPKTRNARYGQTQLRYPLTALRLDRTVTKRISNGGIEVMRGNCEFCGKPISAKRVIYYCSNACKMKAYRRRQDPLTGSSMSTKERIRQSVRTKSAQLVDYVCPTCGLEGKRNGLEALREYCSDACKQKAYRSRQKAKSSIPVPDHTKYSSGAMHQQKYLDDMGVCYRAKYGHAWKFEGGKMDFRNADYYVDVDGQAYRIGGIYMVRRFFEDYLNSGRPNDAMRRAGAEPKDLPRPTPAPYALHMGDHPYLPPDEPVTPARPVQHTVERVAFSLDKKKVTTIAARDPHEVRLGNASKVKVNKPDSKWHEHVGRIGPKPKLAHVSFDGCAWVYFPDSENPHVPVPIEREFLEVIS